MKYGPIMMAAVLAATSLCADDITTLRGEKFTNVTISRVETDGIVVIKRDGVVKIPFSDLSPELRAKYGYGPEKAAQQPTAQQQIVQQRQAEQTGRDAKVTEADRKQIRASLQNFLIEAEKLDAIAEQIVSLSFAYNRAHNDYLAYGSKLGESDKSQSIASDLKQLLPQFDSQLRVAKTRFDYSALPKDTSCYKSFEDALKNYQSVVDIWGDTYQQIAAAIKAKSAFKEAKERLERDLH